MKSLATVLTIVLLAIAVPGEVAAQDPNQGNPTILKAVQEVQSSVNALASQLGDIADLGGNISEVLTDINSQLESMAAVLNALATPPTVLATGFQFKPSGFSAACSAVNAGTSAVTLKLELVKIDGVVQQFSVMEIGPQQGNGFGLAIGSLANHYWCRFTVMSGSSSGLRAHLDVISEVTGLANLISDAR